MGAEIYATILAAGKGSRLGLKNIPKPLVTVKDKPMMEKAVEALYRIGFSSDSIFAVIGHQGEVIQDYFGEDIQYVEQCELNGNAGAVELLTQQINLDDNDSLLVIQGDDSEYINESVLRELISTHTGTEADVTLCLTNKPDEDVHNYEFVMGANGQIIDFVPRQSIDSNGRYMTGTFLFSARFLKLFLPQLREASNGKKELGIAQLLRLAIKSEANVFGIDVNMPYISINTPEGLDRARHLNS